MNVIFSCINYIHNVVQTLIAFIRLICFVKLKQIDCWLFLQQKWVYLESTVNWNSWFCNHGESHANSQQKWQGELFYKGEKEVGRATINGVNGFSLVESSSRMERKGTFLFLIGLRSCHSMCELPLLVFFEIYVC